MILCATPRHAKAQDTRLRTHRYQIGFGETDVLDTYLSQEKFKGSGLTLLINSEYGKASSAWTTVLQNQVHFSSNDDRAKSCTETEACYDLYLGRYYAMHAMGQRLTLQVGGLANFRLGGIYNNKNSNNPAQARLGLQLMPSAAATYQFQINHRPSAVRGEIELPLAGVAFSPNYGQSYYEMFSLGNYDHNVVPTTMVSAPNFRIQLALEYQLSSKYIVSVGYLGDLQQLQVNNLKHHVYSNRLMLGITRKIQKNSN